jgi:predicted ATPase
MLTEQGVELTPYQETEQFTLMKQFVCDPERTLHYLLR